MKLNPLPDAVRAKLDAAISFDTEEDVAQFIADAINTYVELGQRAQSGAQYFVKTGPQAPLQRLRLPFEAQRTQNSAKGE